MRGVTSELKVETEKDFNMMNDTEKVSFIKAKFNLSHGKGKRKKSKKGR